MFVRSLYPFLCLSALLVVPQVGNASQKPQAKKPKPMKPIVLSQRRSYRLVVGKIDPRVFVTLERQWVFRDNFPIGLLRAIRRHPNLKKVEKQLLRNAGRKSDSETGYIRWKPEQKSPNKPGGLLWFVNGKKRKELVIGVDLVLDHKMAGVRKPAALRFDALRVQVDFGKSTLSAVQFNAVKLPAQSKAKTVKIDDTLEVNVTGELTKKSSATIRAANDLLAEEVLQKFRAMAFNALRNDSHHGITLGWLGYESLQHNLLLLPGKPQDNIAFRYRVSGTAFPLKLIARQISDAGWPMVLTGHEYAGTTSTGRTVFRTVEYQLSKPATPKKK